MRIESAALTMSSTSVEIKEVEVKESLTSWVDKQQETGAQKGDTVQISEQARQLKVSEAVKEEDEGHLRLSDKDQAKIMLIERMLELFTRKKVHILVPKIKEAKEAKLAIPLDSGERRAGQTWAAQAQSGINARVGWGLSYDYQQKRYEAEKMSFSSAGVIRTADGREIEFAVNLTMSREFYQENSTSLRLGDAARTDPLVINFDGKAANLTETKFNFDLDSDGTGEQISFLTPGSGFLALDKNGDGLIGDGSELFGPATGSGFGELSAYDRDGNQWLDENDPIFDKLRIWTKDEQGRDQLFSLGQKGIGAIFLGNLATPFSIRSGTNAALGEVATTGIFIGEKGTAGTVQQIDLVV